MSFLDRFKLQPKYKSADADVRVAGVQELSDSTEDTAVLAALAREDADARVRRAAAARINDVSVLAAIASSESEDELRLDVLDRLARIAASSDQPAEGGHALRVLIDQRQIGTVAKASPVEAIRLDAVGRITDLKVLSSVARNGTDARVAASAAERIQDPLELLNVAAKTEHKEAGIGALERAVQIAAPDRATLDDLASRAKHKSVAKRARAMVQALDEAEAARRAALEQHQQRLAGVLARVEALPSAASSAHAASALADAEREWQELSSNAPMELSADDHARFAAASAAAREAIERADRDAAAQRERSERIASDRAAREALCQRVEALQGEETLDEVAKARGEWEGLPVIEGDTPSTDPALL